MLDPATIRKLVIIVTTNAKEESKYSHADLATQCRVDEWQRFYRHNI